MRGRRMKIALASLFVIAAGPVLARMARPPTQVGPPDYPVSTACLPVVTTLGGRGVGAAVPIPGLALGAAVDRNATAFPAGGSGTADLALAAQRKQAGLQYEPKTFDPGGRENPSVFALDVTQPAVRLYYQRLLLKPAGGVILAYGMIFAQATSARTGRIVALALTLARKPGTVPRVTISQPRFAQGRCAEFSPIHIYAPGMSVDQLRRLSTAQRCNWFDRTACTAAERPRGPVLFVQRQRNGLGYEHRWVDYNRL